MAESPLGRKVNMQTKNNTHKHGSEDLFKMFEKLPMWIVGEQGLYTVWSNTQSKKNDHFFISVFRIISVLAGLLFCFLVFEVKGKNDYLAFTFSWFGILNMVFILGLRPLIRNNKSFFLSEHEHNRVELLKRYLELNLGILNFDHHVWHVKDLHVANLVELARRIQSREDLLRARECYDEKNESENFETTSSFDDWMKMKKELNELRDTFSVRFMLMSKLGLINKTKSDIFKQA